LRSKAQKLVLWVFNFSYLSTFGKLYFMNSVSEFWETLSNVVASEVSLRTSGRLLETKD
jgi:hypothetical protein